MPPRTTLAKRKHTSFLSATPRKNVPNTDKNVPGKFITFFPNKTGIKTAKILFYFLRTIPKC